MTGLPARDAGYDDFLDAVEAGEGYYLECPEGHGSLPPRRGCPRCGSRELVEEPLPATGEIETYTTVHVATPAFADDAPYVTVVVDFGPVRVTGLFGEIDEIETGATVVPDVGRTETTGERVLLFHRA